MRVLAAAVALVCLASCAPEFPSSRQQGPISVAEAMGAVPDDGFSRAIAPRVFVFPDDHGPHPGYRTEWWYFTGNLSGSEGHSFGFQLTLFRNALTPDSVERESRWGVRDIWFAHFAVGYEEGDRFFAFERFERGALDLAGARSSPFAAWVGDWRVESLADDSMFPLRLVAAEGEVALELELGAEKPFVLQGDEGLSRKGPEPGDASYYYSATRLAARGNLTVSGVDHEVRGSAWLDREWSTSALSAGQIGWDWFSIQLDDGRELMLYRMRREDGSVDPHNSGALIEANGSVRTFDASDVRYEPLRSWTSPRSGVAYPVEWRLDVEPLNLNLEVRPMLADSEMDLTVRYWEGAIRVSGSDFSGRVDGKGFLEMTGYRGSSTAR